MKRTISLRIDETLWPFVKNKPNRSRYIEGLIREDVQARNQEGIYTALTERLLGDAEYLARLAHKLSQTDSKHVIISKSEDTTVVAGDWGA